MTSTIHTTPKSNSQARLRPAEGGDVAILFLETGLRLREALALKLALKWIDIELDAANGQPYSQYAKGRFAASKALRDTLISPQVFNEVW